ncbi:MAG: J domain-containing protein [Bradyrhizobium sp.]
MGTLYELLGALPGDDAEELRIAFRKAAKATHPDLNPDNPDAPQRFRELVRAYDILTDKEQRTTYDQLLAIALQPEGRTPAPIRTYETMHKVASNTMAATIILAMLVGGYTLFGHFSEPPVAAEMPDGAQQVAALMPDEGQSEREKDVSTVGLANSSTAVPLAKDTARAPIGRFEQVAPFVSYNLGVQHYPRFAAPLYFGQGFGVGRPSEIVRPLASAAPAASAPPAKPPVDVKRPRTVMASAGPRQPLMIVPTFPERRLPITAAITP